MLLIFSTQFQSIPTLSNVFNFALLFPVAVKEPRKSARSHPQFRRSFPHTVEQPKSYQLPTVQRARGRNWKLTRGIGFHTLMRGGTISRGKDIRRENRAIELESGISGSGWSLGDEKKRESSGSQWEMQEKCSLEIGRTRASTRINNEYVLIIWAGRVSGRKQGRAI